MAILILKKDTKKGHFIIIKKSIQQEEESFLQDSVYPFHMKYWATGDELLTEIICTNLISFRALLLHLESVSHIPFSLSYYQPDNRIPTNKCGRNKGNKSPLEHHGSNCSREDAPENVKVNRQTGKKKYLAQNVSPDIYRL